jgi:hypothetical protein
MTAPGSVEFNQGVFAIFNDYFVEVLSNGGLQWSAVVGNCFGFHVRLQFPFFNVIQKFLEGFDPIKQKNPLTFDIFHRPKDVLRESVLHGELSTGSIANSNTGLVVVDVLQTKFVQFLLEVVLVADSKTEGIGEGLSNLEDTVTPVVGSLGIFDVIDSKIGNNNRIFELSCIVDTAVTN